jgi:uncharacterized membrane protein affecting hemolysin expression
LQFVFVEGIEMQHTQPMDLVLWGLLLGFCLPVILALTLLACVKGLEMATDFQDVSVSPHGSSQLSA